MTFSLRCYLCFFSWILFVSVFVNLNIIWGERINHVEIKSFFSFVLSLWVIFFLLILRDVSPGDGLHLAQSMGLPRWLSGKESACQCRTLRKHNLDLWKHRKIPWRRKWQPILVVLPGESHGQRSLVGYSPWDSWESLGLQGEPTSPS